MCGRVDERGAGSHTQIEFFIVGVENGQRMTADGEDQGER